MTPDGDLDPHKGLENAKNVRFASLRMSVKYLKPTSIKRCQQMRNLNASSEDGQWRGSFLALAEQRKPGAIHSQGREPRAAGQVTPNPA